MVVLRRGSETVESCNAFYAGVFGSAGDLVSGRSCSVLLGAAPFRYRTALSFLQLHQMDESAFWLFTFRHPGATSRILMECLRKIGALALVLLFAGYSVLAGAFVHSHEHSASHEAHFLEDRGAQGDRAALLDQQEAGEKNQTAPEGPETGFHSHSSHQFGATESNFLKVYFLSKRLDSWSEPSILHSLTNDGPPFKPPRAIL